MLSDKYDKAKSQGLGLDPVVDRRGFLKVAGSAVVFGLSAIEGLSRAVVAPSARVGMANMGSASASARRAIELAGGMDFIKNGQTVLVKPNVNSPDPFPGSSNPESLLEILKLIKERDPQKIIVADGSNPSWVTIDTMKKVGIYDVVMETGAEVIGFEAVPWVLVNPAGAVSWGPGFFISSVTTQVDHIINVAMVKTHSNATFTMSLKNHVGITNLDSRHTMHGFDRVTLERMIAEINLAVKPSLNILDGTKAFVTGGPFSGDMVEPKTIIASKDRVAADVTGLALLKTFGTVDRIQNRSVWEQDQIKHAVEIGIGVGNGAQIELASDGVTQLPQILEILGAKRTAMDGTSWGKLKARLK